MVHEQWFTILVGVLLFYIAIVAFFFLMQDQMLYHPTRLSPDQAREWAASLNYRSWPADIPDHKGYLAEPASSPALGTIIAFHGNAGAALDRTYYAEAMNRLGYRVILAEYPGYGSRPGKWGEHTFVADAVVLLEEARARFGGPIFLMGESLGAAVAAALAARRPSDVDGIALITPWDALPRVAQAKYPILPARFMIKSKFDNIANLASYTGPKAVLHAGKDSIVPPKHAIRLYESLAEPRLLRTFEGAGHNSWPTSPGEAWWAELIEFLSEH